MDGPAAYLQALGAFGDRYSNNRQRFSFAPSSTHVEFLQCVMPSVLSRCYWFSPAYPRHREEIRQTSLMRLPPVDLNISHVLPHSSRIPLWDVTVQIVRWAPLHRLLVDHQLLGSTRFNCSLADASTVRTSVLPPAIRRGWQPMLGHPGSAEANGR